MEENPYESPKTIAGFRDDQQYVSDLERRVADLERRVSASWFTHPNFFAKLFAVWAYLIGGYILGLVIVVPIIYLIDWLAPSLWPQ